MRNKYSFAATLTFPLALAGVARTDAVELLMSGNFETPGGLVGEVPGWTLTEFATESSAAVNSAEVTGGADVQLFLRAFEGGSPLHPARATSTTTDCRGVASTASTSSPGSGTWGKPPPCLRGGCTGGLNGGPDENIDAESDILDDRTLATGVAITNARLVKPCLARPGETYTFTGTSTLRNSIPGFVTRWDPTARSVGTIPSPTVTRFQMNFWTRPGSDHCPASRDLRSDYVPAGPNLPGLFPSFTPAV